ncbi:MAG TPA: hypothetical protein VFL55_15300, partial [Acetobacteraceae bacterium]|nr:hypothetical protein [Acetobacteraceae bacterium]
WVYGSDPAKAFEGIKAKAQWAENHGFVWCSVMDHLIQIGGVGAPTEPFIEGWTVRYCRHWPRSPVAFAIRRISPRLPPVWTRSATAA